MDPQKAQAQVVCHVLASVAQWVVGISIAGLRATRIGVILLLIGLWMTIQVEAVWNELR
jgi:hypothetical protein